MFVHQHYCVRSLQLFQYQFAFALFLLLFTQTLCVFEFGNGSDGERHVMGDTLGIILDASNEMLVDGFAHQYEFSLHFPSFTFVLRPLPHPYNNPVRCAWDF